MRIHFRPLSALLAATLLVLAGCGPLPTPPSTSLSSAAPAQSAAVSNPKVQPGACSSQVISGLLGGTVAAGDFTIVIPPLAFTGTATVTVDQPDLSAPVVDLSITPASKNQFRLPVTLLAKASLMDQQALSIAYISYFNPSTGKWEPVPGSTVNLLNLTVQAPLSHFSNYRVECQGRAGW